MLQRHVVSEFFDVPRKKHIYRQVHQRRRLMCLGTSLTNVGSLKSLRAKYVYCNLQSSEIFWPSGDKGGKLWEREREGWGTGEKSECLRRIINI